MVRVHGRAWRELPPGSRHPALASRAGGGGAAGVPEVADRPARDGEDGRSVVFPELKAEAARHVVSIRGAPRRTGEGACTVPGGGAPGAPRPGVEAVLISDM